MSLNAGWTSTDMGRSDRGATDIFGPWFWEHEVVITQNFHLVISNAHCLFIQCDWPMQWLPRVTTTALCDNASCSSPGPGGTEHPTISQHTGKPSCIPHQVWRVRMLHSLSNKMHTLAVLNWWRALHGNLHQKFKKCMLMSFCKLESCRCQERTTWIEQNSVISAGGV